MPNCRVCGKFKALNEQKICLDCVDVKLFKCYCCERRFSYTELVARNLHVSSQYKCINPKITKIQCKYCNRPKYLIIKYNYHCLYCTNKDNFPERLKEAERQLDIEYKKKALSIKGCENAEINIQALFIKLKQIEDPIFDQDKLKGLLNKINNEYTHLASLERQTLECMGIIKYQKDRINELQTDINNINNNKNCYNAAKTFLLCGLRPEVVLYIPKQIQRMIVVYILKEFFLIGF